MNGTGSAQRLLPAYYKRYYILHDCSRSFRRFLQNKQPANVNMVEAPGIEPPASATGNLLRNAVLARKSPETLAVDAPGHLLSVPSHTTSRRRVEAHRGHTDAKLRIP